MFTYGYMEARMYVPTNAQGIPEDMLTFWADGLNWPQDWRDRRDGDAQVVRVRSCVAFPQQRWYRGRLRASGPSERVAHVRRRVGAGVGHVLLRRTIGRTGGPGITGAPMYLVLSFIVNPYVGGPAVPSAHAYVKYVRVWQQSNQIFTFLLGARCAGILAGCAASAGHCGGSPAVAVRLSSSIPLTPLRGH